MQSSRTNIDLTIVIPALREAENLALLLPGLRNMTASLGLEAEIVVVDEQCDDRTREVAAENKIVVLEPDSHGYGRALWSGLAYARSDYVVTMDADLSHPPTFLADLWSARQAADIIIASRYVPGGRAVMPASRYWLSRILNLMFGRGLSLNVRDLSSGYRLYNRRSLPELTPASIDFDILQELLVKVYTQGFTILEVPFTYEPRHSGSSHARVLKFGLAYLRTFQGLWKLRNSVASADYDYRAYNSWVPPQRYWQRKRYQYIREMVKGKGACLDIGCGSSRILETLPPGSVALDLLFRKLRFARRYNLPRLQGSLLELPVADKSFPCVVCSQAIEHVSRDKVMDELDRVLQPGGYLVLGTPGYGNWEWLYKKLLPQAYADEHITHYTYEELVDEFVNQRGYQLLDNHYILHGELILGLQKPRV